MSGAANRRLRAPLLLLAGLLLLGDTGIFRALGGGGEVSFSLGQWLRGIGPVIVATALPGLLAGLAVGGASGLRAATRFAFGCEDAARAAAPTLRAAASAAAGAGLLLGLAGAVLLFASLAEAMASGPDPALMAQRITLVLGAPLAGLVAGRLLLGSLADAAFLRAGQGRAAAARPWNDVVWLALIAFPALVFFVLTYRFGSV